MTEVNIPAGFRQDGKGNLVPEAKISEFKLTRDEFVQELFGKAEEMNKVLSDFKGMVIGDLDAFVELSAEKHDETVRGAKGSYSLFSFDGRYKIQVAVQNLTCFDEGIKIAQQLVLEVAEEWQEELSEVEGVASAADMAQAIHYAFEADRDGKLSQARVRSIRNWKIKHPKWIKAMDIIDESLQTIGERSYVRFYQRRNANSDNYDLLPLDFAGV